MMKWDLHMPLEDGMEVKVVGTPKLFQQSGKFHLRVMEVELVGAGALQRAFTLLKEKLEKEGLFAPERKRPLPRFPAHIGLVTSQDAAACTDVLRVLNNRWRGLHVTVTHTQTPDVVLIDYVTRFRNTIVTQTNWSGGTATSTVTSFGTTYESSDSNVDVTGTAGSIKLNSQ